MSLSIIVALSENGVIGHLGSLPWRLPKDLAHFKSITLGHIIVMGRKTFESIGRPLPGRTSWVISRQPEYHADGVRVFSTIDEALGALPCDGEHFVIGGGEIYRQCLSRTDRLYVTRVHVRIDGDTIFPRIDDRNWELAEREFHEIDSKNPHALTFERWTRK